MDKLKELTKRAADLRVEINKLASAEDADLDTLREKRAEYEALETRRAALLAIEGAADGAEPIETRDDGEGREIRAILDRAELGAIFEAALEQRSTDGAEDELQKHFGLRSNQIPIAMLRDLETRAVTPAPTNTGASQRPIVQPIFHAGDAAFLGVSMPRVPAGDAVFPILTTRPTVSSYGTTTDTAAAETTGAFDAESLSPKRLQARFSYRRTEAARFRGMSAALRQALTSGLSEGLDKAIVDQIVTDVTRTDASAADTFAAVRKRFCYSAIDGRFASREGDIKLLVGADTLADWSELYRGNNADDSAVDSIRRITGGVRVSPHIADVASNKQDVICRLGMRMDAQAPVWDGVTIIPDEVTEAAKGQVKIHAVMLYNVKVTRTAGFKRIQAQHS